MALFLDYDQELPVPGNMLRIYKPFTILSIAAVFNGQKVLYGKDLHAGLHNGFIAPQANVLVVDDNAMNLKVMARLLLPYRLKVTLAGSGQEALEKLNKPNYDCVFLDHMMPEMDGVETLHKIRQKPGAYYQSLPIIAFTANAIGGARDMFLSEGFNDFIAKPIELSVLERILRRYIPSQLQIPVEMNDSPLQGDFSQMTDEQPGSREMTGESAPAKEKACAAASPCPDAVNARDDAARGRLRLARAGIDMERAFTYCVDETGFREIIAIFHAEGEKRRDNLSRCFQEQDWENYVICVHALKGNAKGIGADELSEMAEKLELAGKENRTDYILEHHQAMMENHDRLLEALSGNTFVYPGIPGDSPASTAEETGLQNLLSQIEEKLSSFENAGLPDLLDRLSQFQTEDASLAELAKSLRKLTQDFDFLGASELLERMGK